MSMLNKLVNSSTRRGLDAPASVSSPVGSPSRKDSKHEPALAPTAQTADLANDIEQVMEPSEEERAPPSPGLGLSKESKEQEPFPAANLTHEEELADIQMDLNRFLFDYDQFRRVGETIRECCQRSGLLQPD